MDVNILIQRLQQGEVTGPDRQPPTSLALQAARALQQLVALNEGNLRVINQLNQDVAQLHEQLQLLQSNQSSRSTS